MERKPEGASSGEIRAVACGFANSVSPGSTGVLFIGVANDGTILGVANSDSLQKTVRRQLTVECYPPIEYQAFVLDEGGEPAEGGKPIVAIEVPASSRRPHFTGPAYVRIGAETVAASEPQYDQLIATRNTVAGVLARAIGETWRVMAIGKRLGDTKPIQQPGHRESAECRIVEVNAHYVRLHLTASGTNYTEELSRAEISYDEKRHQKLLIVRGA